MGEMLVFFWNIVVVFCMVIIGLLPPLPLFLYAFFITFFSFLSYDDSRFTAVLYGKFRGFINFPPLVFVPTGDMLGVIRKNI